LERIRSDLNGLDKFGFNLNVVKWKGFNWIKLKIKREDHLGLEKIGMVLIRKNLIRIYWIGNRWFGEDSYRKN